MYYVAPPVKEVIIKEIDYEDFDFSKMGVTFEYTNLLEIKEVKDKYSKLKEKIEKITSIEVPKDPKPYMRIPYINIKKDGYTVQSITEIDGKMLISAYKRKHYSRLYIYNIDTYSYEGKIILDNKAHVGGISFDHTNDILYITGSNGEINSYDYKIIRELNNEKNYTINFSDRVENEEEDQLEIKINNNINVKNLDKYAEASTIYYYNNRLYVATFNPTGKGYLYSYKVNYNKENKSISIIDEHTKKYKIGARVQGIALTNYGNKDYLVCSQSIGIANSSILIYEITEDDLVFVGRTYINDHGLEGIAIDDDNNLVGIFENNPRPIIVLSMKELLDEVSSSLLDVSPGNELSSYLGGVVYRLLH